MGEAERRSDARRAAHDAIVKAMLNRGLIIEAGWTALRAAWMHPASPPDQVRDYRWAFFAGAQHLYASLMTGLDPEHEPTDDDMKRMELIPDELERFRVEMEASPPTEGRA